MRFTRTQIATRNLRRGSLLMEVVVTTAMLAALLVIINQAIVRLQKQTAALDNHRFAQQTLENLLEELTARQWSKLETASISQLSISELAQSKLPDVAVNGEVVLQPDPVPAKRVRVELAWSPQPGVKRDLNLTTWVYEASGSRDEQ